MMGERKTVKLSSLKPNERNPRLISDGAFKKLCESIERDPQFMELRPIIVDDDNVIIGGNQRYRACVKLGKTSIPASWVRRAMGLTAKQRKRFILMDNAPEGAAGYWDFVMLQEEFKLTELEDLGFVFAQKIDIDGEWQGMPEFVQEEFKGYKRLIVNFLEKKDYEKFVKLIGQKLTEKTKTIWYPKQDFDQMARGEEYVEKP